MGEASKTETLSCRIWEFILLIWGFSGEVIVWCGVLKEVRHHEAVETVAESRNLPRTGCVEINGFTHSSMPFMYNRSFPFGWFQSPSPQESPPPTFQSLSAHQERRRCGHRDSLSARTMFLGVCR